MRSEGYGVCVCPHYRLRGGLRAIPNASVLQALENENGDFSETSAFEREKLPLSRTGLRGPTFNKRCACKLAHLDLIRLLCVPAQEATAKGVYRLPHAIYYCS